MLKVMEMAEVTQCDFCGIPKEKADRLIDVYHLADFPFLICTECMDREYGPAPKDPFIRMANSLQLGGEEE